MVITQEIDNRMKFLMLQSNKKFYANAIAQKILRIEALQKRAESTPDKIQAYKLLLEIDEETMLAKAYQQLGRETDEKIKQLPMPQWTEEEVQ